MIRPTSRPTRQRVLPDKPMNSAPATGFCEAPPTPCLRFSPTAWAKLLFLRDAGETEVGGFGISAAENLLLIKDFQLVKQVCDTASVSFDDASVADFFDRQFDAGLKPSQAGRLWIHTHPGFCAQPSAVDEETFARVFGRADWALMFVLARGGATFARLQFNVGPKGSLSLPVEVDYRQPFKASDHAAWREEYETNVEVVPWQPTVASLPPSVPELWDDCGHFYDLFDDDLGFSPISTERQFEHDF
jgi:hypothetical protein